MSKPNRKTRIIALLQEAGSVSVATLAEEFHVSDVTIRSDLSALEKEGFVYRTHGGAVLRKPQTKESAPSRLPLAVLETAKVAARHIQDRSWVFLGSGSTCYAISQFAADRDVNIVTNNLAVTNALAASHATSVVVTGGNLFKSRYPFLYGDQLLSSLSDIYFAQAFFGVSGIDLNFGFSISNSVEKSIFQKVCQISQEVIIVADSSKYSQNSFMGVGPLTVANTVISTGEISAKFTDYFAQKNIRFISE